MKYITVEMQQFMATTFSPDGRYLVSLHASARVRFWDVADFTQRLWVRLPIIPSIDHRLALLGRHLLTPQFLYDLGETWEKLAAPRGRKAIKVVGRRVKLENVDDFALPTLTAGRKDSEVIGVLAAGYQRTRGPFEIGFWRLDGSCQAFFGIESSSRESWREFRWPDALVSPDGRFLAGAQGHRVILLPLGQLDRRVEKPDRTELHHTDEVRRLCFSPDGRFLATGAGRSVWLWDLAGAPASFRFPAFRQFIERLAFHPSGRLFAAGSRDGEVRVYETGSRKEVMRLDLELGEIRGLEFAPDGMTAVAAGQTNQLAVWDVD
jgi:WD40 repeat protein